MEYNIISEVPMSLVHIHICMNLFTFQHSDSICVTVLCLDLAEPRPKYECVEVTLITLKKKIHIVTLTQQLTTDFHLRTTATSEIQ